MTVASQAHMALKSLSRFVAMENGDRLLLADALLTLAMASLAIRILPFKHVARTAAIKPRHKAIPSRAAEATIARARWAVEAWARRVPWRAVCFQKGIALHWMLRRRGIATIVHYGVGQDPVEGLRAHVWVTERGMAIIGGEVAKDYACLASFPEQ